MRCSIARTLMTKGLREPLAPAQSGDLQRHLSSCASCRSEQAEQQPLEAALTRLRPAFDEPVPEVRVDTGAILRDSRAPRPALWAIGPAPAAALGLAGCAALVLALRGPHHSNGN